MVGGRALVLQEDPELAAAVAAEHHPRALDASVAATIEVEVGTWSAQRDADRARDGYGLLVLGGVLVRRVGDEGRFGAELLSTGDVLRPWESDGEASLAFETVWRVLTPVRLAVLDLAWARRMAAFPEVGAALAGRALSRSRRLASIMAIAQHPRLEDRIWMLFWELADRHGRVRPDGVHLELPVTHEVLSHLVAARRPSVSSALGRLEKQGRLLRIDREWVLVGESPLWR